ncbi:MAG: CBS domain-containing protein [Alphaproteobacteria bacterium]|nr:CBS domain-containing protein [Alphaproteobacteria bacterium]
MLPVERTVVPFAISVQRLVTMSPMTPVSIAAQEMAERRIGAVLVVEDGELQGIFTERDALVRVLARRRDPEATQLAEVMTRNPDTIRPDDQVVYALAIMNERGYRHLPVVDGERIVGIVSVRDLYRSIKEQMDADLLLLAETLIQG